MGRARRRGVFGARLPVVAAFFFLLYLGPAFVLVGAPVAHAVGGPAGKAASAEGQAGAAYQSAGGVKVSGSTVASGTDVNLVETFNGLAWGNNYNTFSPPDPQLAVGPSEVVEMVNVYEEIFNKTGGSVNSVPLHQVFGVGASEDIGDPRILYDNLSGRFFASVYDFTTQGVIIAVSLGSTVDGGWYAQSLFADKLPNVCMDQPYIAVTTDKVVVTANGFYNGGTTSPCRPLGYNADQVIWAVNKAQMVAQASPFYYYFYYDYGTFRYYGVRPVSSPTSTAYLVCSTCGYGEILLFQATGVPTSSSQPTLTQQPIAWPTPSSPPEAFHLGNSSDVLDTDGTVEIQNTYWSNGIWLTMMDSCLPSGDNTFRSCVRLVQIGQTLNQVFTNEDVYGPAGFYLFYPAVVADGYGGLGLVAGYSSATTYPSLLVTGVKSGEPIGDLVSNEATVAAGTGYSCHYSRSNGVCRYGDYAGAALDPSDPSLMWFNGEFETSTGWATGIAAMRVGLAAVTLSYAVQDGSLAPQTPAVSFTRGGAGYTATLSGTPVTYVMDLGSSWSAGASLGGSSTEQWGTSGTPQAQVTGDSSVQIVYYHQYQVTPSYAVVGGGSASAPSVTCTQFGLSSPASIGTATWADAGSSCTYQQALPGPSSGERWAASSASVAVGSAGTITESYYRQYEATLSYTVTGGGTPPAPALVEVEYGSPTTTALTASASGYWLDAGSAWSVSGTLSGSTGERWVTSGPQSGTATGAFAETLAYQHQYYLSLAGTPSQGGSLPQSGWYDAGTTVSLDATASAGWQFEGWAGIGSGAYSGSSASTSFALNAPTNETATFYPGLTITVSGSGSVQYSYGSTQGTVSSGTPIFAPAGTAITITESPSSLFFSFDGWGGMLAGSASQQQVQLSSPASLTASFGYNYVVLVGIGAVVVGVVVGAFFGLKRRGGGIGLPPPPPP